MNAVAYFVGQVVRGTLWVRRIVNPPAARRHACLGCGRCYFVGQPILLQPAFSRLSSPRDVSVSVARDPKEPSPPRLNALRSRASYNPKAFRISPESPPPSRAHRPAQRLKRDIAR